MTDHPIYNVIELLKKARQAEAASAVALADARANVERAKDIAISEAYSLGQIAGTNAEKRRAEEAGIVAASTAIREAEVHARLLDSKHTADRIEVDYQKERYAAMLALTRVEADTAWPMPG